MRSSRSKGSPLGRMTSPEFEKTAMGSCSMLMHAASNHSRNPHPWYFPPFLSWESTYVCPQFSPFWLSDLPWWDSHRRSMRRSSMTLPFTRCSGSRCRTLRARVADHTMAPKLLMFYNRVTNLILYIRSILYIYTYIYIYIILILLLCIYLIVSIYIWVCVRVYVILLYVDMYEYIYIYIWIHEYIYIYILYYIYVYTCIYIYIWSLWTYTGGGPASHFIDIKWFSL